MKEQNYIVYFLLALLHSKFAVGIVYTCKQHKFYTHIWLIKQAGTNRTCRIFCLL